MSINKKANMRARWYAFLGPRAESNCNLPFTMLVRPWSAHGFWRDTEVNLAHLATMYSIQNPVIVVTKISMLYLCSIKFSLRTLWNITSHNIIHCSFRREQVCTDNHIESSSCILQQNMPNSFEEYICPLLYIISAWYNLLEWKLQEYGKQPEMVLWQWLHFLLLLLFPAHVRLLQSLTNAFLLDN